MIQTKVPQGMREPQRFVEDVRVRFDFNALTEIL